VQKARTRRKKNAPRSEKRKRKEKSEFFHKTRIFFLFLEIIVYKKTHFARLVLLFYGSPFGFFRSKREGQDPFSYPSRIPCFL